MQALFDPVISEITSLVSQQVKEAKSKKNAKIDVWSNIPVSKFIWRNLTDFILFSAHYSCWWIC
jgi:hypothetical protein